ncbi:MAG: lactonase family protein [Solirubrobacterales bacterium]
MLLISLATAATAALATSVGTLKPKGCIADHANDPDICGKQAQGLNGAQWVTVSPDSRSVYVAGYSDNTIVTFRRNRKTGALKSKGCIGEKGAPAGCATNTKGLGNAQAIAVSPNGKSAYAVSEGDNAIVTFKRSRKTGRLHPGGCIGAKGHNPAHCGQTARGLYIASSVIVSSDGTSVYVAGDGDNAIAVFRRNTSTGALTPKGCIADSADNPAGCGTTTKGIEAPYSVTTTADGKSVYAAGSNSNSVAAFKRSSPGALTPRGCIAETGNDTDGCGTTTLGLGEPFTVTATKDGRSVYAAGALSNAVVRFKRSSSGALTPKDCIGDATSNPDNCPTTTAGLNSPYAVTASPDGRSVYVASFYDNAVVSFRRGRNTGALTPAGCIADPLHNPDSCPKTARGLYGTYAVAVTPNGKSAYAVGAAANAIVLFRRAL